MTYVEWWLQKKPPSIYVLRNYARERHLFVKKLARSFAVSHSSRYARGRSMASHDYDKAKTVRAALLSLLIAEPGGTTNHAVVARVSALCDAAVDAVNDI